MRPETSKPVVRLVAVIACLPSAAFAIFILSRMQQLSLRHPVPIILFLIGFTALPVWLTFRAFKPFPKQPPSNRPPGDRPWLKRTDWARGQIAAEENRPIPVAFAIMGGACILGTGATAVREGISREPALLLFFLILGVVFIATSLYLAAYRNKFGRSILKLDPCPGTIGRAITGAILIDRKLAPADVKLRLQCLANKPNDSEEASILWEGRQVCRPQDAGLDSTAIPLHIPIPADCPETGFHHAFWRLEVEAQQPRLNYRATFDVPVFRLN